MTATRLRVAAADRRVAGRLAAALGLRAAGTPVARAPAAAQPVEVQVPALALAVASASTAGSISTPSLAAPSPVRSLPRVVPRFRPKPRRVARWWPAKES